jgi:hypothetical protein
MKTMQLVLLTGLFLGLALGGGIAQQAPTVTIQSHQQTQPDGTMQYAYRVINRGAHRVVGFTIGRDYSGDVSELSVEPVGWNFDAGLAPGSTTSPPSWEAILVTNEESPLLELAWNNDGSADILAGQTAAGFSVITPQPDRAYLHGRWTVFFADATMESALLVPDDNSAPADLPSSIPSKRPN